MPTYKVTVKILRRMEIQVDASDKAGAKEAAEDSVADAGMGHCEVEKIEVIKK